MYIYTHRCIYMERMLIYLHICIYDKGIYVQIHIPYIYIYVSIYTYLVT